jgi:hypothetical protein
MSNLPLMRAPRHCYPQYGLMNQHGTHARATPTTESQHVRRVAGQAGRARRLHIPWSGRSSNEGNVDLSVFIYTGLVCYAVAIVGLLRIAQSIRKKDDLLRAITSQWIEEAGSTESPPQ